VCVCVVVVGCVMLDVRARVCGSGGVVVVVCYT